METMPSTLHPSKPATNQLLQLTALRLAATIQTLTDRGFTVIGLEASKDATPTIQIEGCSKCVSLIERGEAIHYRFSGSGSGRERRGQFKVGPVRVVWIEFGA